MGAQMKKGVLDLCVLSLINGRDHYGYELIQRVEEYVEISEGTIYPILKKLTLDGYLDYYLKEADFGPARKYYSITEKGLDHLNILVREWEELMRGVNNLLEARGQ